MQEEAMDLVTECGLVNQPSYLLKDVHINLQPPTDDGSTVVVKGPYFYYHYGCDGFKDTGWGCGYRTLQTICSWVRDANTQLEPPPVPTIPEIQQLLVQMEDKPPQFQGSRDWIGSFETCLVLDQLYQVPCKLVHISRGNDIGKHITTLLSHFSQLGSPIMMGGDQDCSSKGIMGVHHSPASSYLLVVDPHFTGHVRDSQHLQARGWVKWQSLQDFVDSSFYNLCLPQLAHPTLTCSTS